MVVEEEEHEAVEFEGSDEDDSGAEPLPEYTGPKLMASAMNLSSSDET